MQRDLADVKVSECCSRTLHRTLDTDRHAGCGIKHISEGLGEDETFLKSEGWRKT